MRDGTNDWALALAMLNLELVRGVCPVNKKKVHVCNKGALLHTELCGSYIKLTQ